ncbi:hypothetical protein M011DRAFT_479905 [Sporormia fimetaria CBS 119925]|uniref:Uncharacterized protein n=1 Tax=Sporormia fimetaria CBS 119925 TaxID=1340428 RepID=A0A6A6V543_9PLEO|nr:hypothetical protein M011DRAFT_479905 [Sporormia fimetaria CBS 119925]
MQSPSASYWLSTAYALLHSSSNSFHYQYSVPFASHGEDATGYFGPAKPNQPRAFALMFRRISGKGFVRRSDLSVEGQRFPAWKAGRDSRVLNLNTTGGVPYELETQYGVTVTQFHDPGVRAKVSTVDAIKLEGGNGVSYGRSR